MYATMVVDGNLYYAYFFFDESNAAFTYQYHRIDLSTGIDTLMIEGDYYQFNVVGDTSYYFDGADLRACDLDGQNDRLIARGYDSDSTYKHTLHNSGDWLFYSADDKYYRMKPDESAFPANSLG
jgi:hypothetical protein